MASSAAALAGEVAGAIIRGQPMGPHAEERLGALLPGVASLR